jgi:hypothetical protein
VITKELFNPMSATCRFVAVGAILLTGLSALPCWSQTTNNFRIETDILLADRAEPIHQSVTIFQNGVAYDFSRVEPHRITVIDPQENRIVFLDSERELQTRINLEELFEFMKRARQELAKSSLAASLEDSETVDVDLERNVISVGKNYCRYVATLQQPELPAIAEQFASFANASACINAWQSPDRSPPSFARLKLNELVLESRSLPVEITRTLFNARGHEQTVKSRIHANWNLSPEDERLAEKFTAMLLVYPSMEVGEFMATKRMLQR